jgi:hypothetical protein
MGIREVGIIGLHICFRNTTTRHHFATLEPDRPNYPQAAWPLRRCGRRRLFTEVASIPSLDAQTAPASNFGPPPVNQPGKYADRQRRSPEQPRNSVRERTKLLARTLAEMERHPHHDNGVTQQE